MKRTLCSLRLAAILLAAAAAHADVLQAQRAGDVLELEALARRDDADGRLAQALALSMRRRDVVAEPALARAAEAGDAARRSVALQELAALRLRNGRFKHGREALDAAAQLAPLDAEVEQTRAFLAALSPVPAMRVEPGARGSLPLSRDAAALARVDGRLEGQAQSFVVDTGAAFSTVTASTARRLGLRWLDTSASVGSSSNAAVASRFAVAKELVLDRAVLHDVVFIVLPDEALSFDGGYRIDAIVGLPVFLSLGRVAVESTDGGERLRLGPDAPVSTATPNLLFNGLQPILLARAGQAREPMRFFIDSGAPSTLLVRNALDALPDLQGQARSRALAIGGAGGTKRDEQALELPQLALHVGDQSVVLKNVSLLSEREPDRHGTIGQDVLRHGRGFVMDFERMCLELLR